MAYTTAENRKLAAIVCSLRDKPPINFHVALHANAAHHGLIVHKIEYHAGPKVHIHVSGFHIAHVHEYSKTLLHKFPHILTSAKVVLPHALKGVKE